MIATHLGDPELKAPPAPGGATGPGGAVGRCRRALRAAKSRSGPSRRDRRAMLVMAAFPSDRALPLRETIRGARMGRRSAAHWLGTDNLSRNVEPRRVRRAGVVTVGFGTIRSPSSSPPPSVSSAYFGGLWDLTVSGWWTRGSRFPTRHHPVVMGGARPGG